MEAAAKLHLRQKRLTLGFADVVQRQEVCRKQRRIFRRLDFKKELLNRQLQAAPCLLASELWQDKIRR
jgi:hypothetical protein